MWAYHGSAAYGWKRQVCQEDGELAAGFEIFGICRCAHRPGGYGLIVFVSPLLFLFDTTPPRLSRTSSLKTTLVQRGSNDPLSQPEDNDSGSTGTYRTRGATSSTPNPWPDNASDQCGDVRDKGRNEGQGEKEIRCVPCLQDSFCPTDNAYPCDDAYPHRQRPRTQREEFTSPPNMPPPAHSTHTPRDDATAKRVQ